MTTTWRPHAERFRTALAAGRPERVGVVSSIVGLGLEISGLDCAIGDLVRVGDIVAIKKRTVPFSEGASSVKLGSP